MTYSQYLAEQKRLCQSNAVAVFIATAYTVMRDGQGGKLLQDAIESTMPDVRMVQPFAGSHHGDRYCAES